MTEAVCIPSNLAPPGSPKAKQLCRLHTQTSLKQSCDRQKYSCVYACRVTSVVSNSLRPCGLWLPGFIVTGALQARITVCIGQYWLPLFWSTIFPAALAANSPEYLVLPEPLQPKQLHYLHNWPLLGQNPNPPGQPQEQASGANPSG